MKTNTTCGSALVCFTLKSGLFMRPIFFCSAINCPPVVHIWKTGTQSSTLNATELNMVRHAGFVQTFAVALDGNLLPIK